MALSTLGTNANNTLQALNWNPMSAVADVAAISEAIRGQSAFGRNIPQFFANNGRLQFPGRHGFILLNTGDYIAVDANGWPIVVSSNSIAGQLAASSWTHNP